MADLSDFELINFGGLPTVSPSGTNHLMLDNGTTTGKNTINNIVAAAQATQDNAAAIAANAAAISSLNSNLSKNVADGIIDGSGNFATTFVVSSSSNRIPVLIGGNNTNKQFLRLYQIDLSNLTSSLTEQTRFADCVSYSGNTITVLANADGGNTSRLRIRVSQTAGYSHVFICPMVICTVV